MYYKLIYSKISGKMKMLYFSTDVLVLNINACNNWTYSTSVKKTNNNNSRSAQYHFRKMSLEGIFKKFLFYFIFLKCFISLSFSIFFQFILFSFCLSFFIFICTRVFLKKVQKPFEEPLVCCTFFFKGAVCNILVRVSRPVMQSFLRESLRHSLLIGRFDCKLLH